MLRNKFQFAAIFIFALVVLACLSNQPTGPTPNVNAASNIPSPTPLAADHDRRIIKEEGWTIPPISNATLEKTEKVKIDGLSVGKTSFQLAENYILAASREDRAYEQEYWRISTVDKFDASGKTIGYSLSGAKVSLNDDRTVKNVIATWMTYHLYDDDGDGIFETLEYGHFPNPDLRLPKHLKTVK